MKRHTFRLLFCLLIALMPRGLEARSNLLLTSPEPVRITPHLQIFEDSSRSISIDRIIGGDPSIVFVPVHQLNLGYSKSVFWLKISIDNKSRLEHWSLSADNPLLQFTAYVQNSSDPKALKIYHPENRLSLVSEIFLAAQAKSIIYLEVSSRHIVDLNFQLMNQNDFDNQMLRKVSFLSAYAGIALALFLYNGFVYLSLRDKNYLYYLLFMAINIHLNLMAAGFPSQIFHLFGWDWWQLCHFYRPMAPMSLFLFTRVLFHTKDNHPKFDKALLAYMMGLLLLSLSNVFVDPAVLFELEDPYFLLGIILSFWIGFASLKRKSAPSIYYMIALSTFTAGIAVYIAAMENIIQINFMTLNAHMIGHSCELVIMSLALASNIKYLQMRSFTYQKKLAHHAKLSSLGMMAGGLAHEIGNPLAIVMGQIRIAKHLMAKGSTDQIEMRISSAYQNCERIEKIIQAVRNLYEGSHLPGDALFKLEDAVNSVVHIYRDRMQSEKVRLDLRIAPFVQLKAHPMHIEIVLRILMD